MKNILRIELPPLRALTRDARVAFALLDRQRALQRSGELGLHELAAAVPADRIEALLHPADSVVSAVAVPPLPAHRMDAAVAGAVEPLLLGDADTLAVAHGTRAADGMVAVAWAPREWLAHALALLADAGLPVHALVPAQLALPLPPSGWAAARRDTHLVVRTGAESGYCWAIDPLASDAEDPARLSLALAIEQAAPEAVCWIGPPPDGWQPPDGVALDTQPDTARWQGMLPAWSLALPSLRPAHASRSPLRRPLAWALGAAAVWLFGLNVHAWQLGREETQLRTQMTEQVKTAFPDIPVIVDPLKQAEQRRNALRAAGGRFDDADFLPLALATAELLPQAASNVVSLGYADEELRLRLVDDAIGMVTPGAAAAAQPAASPARRLGRAGRPAPAQQPAAPRAEIDPAILQKAQALGLAVDRQDGEWRIRRASDGASTPATGVVIQTNGGSR